MDNIHIREAAQNATKKKFRGRKTLQARGTPRYPSSAERELQRLANIYLTEMTKELKKELPGLMAEYKNSTREDSRFDAGFEFTKKVQNIFKKVSESVTSKLASFNLVGLVQKISRMVKNSSVRDWARIIKSTLGIEIPSEYYGDDFFSQQLSTWVTENVSRIRSLPDESLADMEKIILEGYQEHKSLEEIQDAIQKRYGVDKRRAKLIARDQVSTLHSQVTQAQQRDAGCTRYKWSSAGDSLVRDCHATLNGHIFSWDDPPEMWYRTKAGIVYTGRHCHPGEDYCCRCVAIPVFDYETLSIPTP